ncbi:MAG: GTPase HflX [Clostridia bacterium 41_269]|nr:MAG: GTPase HflX [Clostridia bacterium 41_269]
MSGFLDAVGKEEGKRALLVTLQLPGDSKEKIEISLEELKGLVETAGCTAVGYEVQKRDSPCASLFLGKGKALELEERRKAGEFDMLVFNHDLSPTQQRNLEDIIQCPIIDRTTLILDIFAQRAKTKEAKLQVELAQLQYRLPRLTGRGTALNRLGGGIGTRGPGLTKLEVDRRKIRDRIAYITRELKKIEKHRRLIRKRRLSRDVPVVALTGYTNVGKSTLHDVLSGSGTYADDRLFATLDSTARKVVPKCGEPYVLIDTVGFIRDLPPKLVAAFRSTLEELQYSDLLLHVVDSTSKDIDQEIELVEKVLGELEVLEKPRILVFNKIDKIKGTLPKVSHGAQKEVYISALKGIGIEELNKVIQEEISRDREEMEVFISYEKFEILDLVYKEGVVLEQKPQENGIFLKVVLKKAAAGKIKKELGEKTSTSSV